MPKTRISCPNCRQPVVADINQLFDVGQDPSAKQRLLSGDFNLIQCQNCGYQGNASSAIVYHDPAKEMLITYVPPELNLPMGEQERLLGSLITQVVNHLPQEQRKAYLLRPQPTFTMQGMVERILESDGITKDMIQAQQQRLNLLQRLASASTPEIQAEMARQDDALIDAEFFTLLQRLMESAAATGDQASIKKLEELQTTILHETTFGKELLLQSQEVQAAVKDLQALGRDLTREKLLDLMVDAPNETRLEALVSLTRPAMDYNFFQVLSDRIDRSRGDGRTRLVDLRTKLLEMTKEIDQQLEARRADTRKLLDTIIQSPEPEQALVQNLSAVDEFFLEELKVAEDEARKQGNLERLGKIQRVVDTLEQMSRKPPEVELVEELLDVPDDEQQEVNWRKVLNANADLITPEFLDALVGIASQVQQSGDEVLARRIMALNRLAIRISMEREMKGQS
jgi:hypothetical protein